MAIQRLLTWPEAGYPSDHADKYIEEKGYHLSKNGRASAGLSVIGRMKGLSADWETWRNVLGPGQSTTVFGGRGKRGRGYTL